MDKRFGLIGSPISTSLSPTLFRAGYDGRYPYDLIEGDNFLTSWKRFLDDYTAINVTAPFKEDAFAQALGLAHDGYGSISGPCFKIRATNLLVKTPQGIEAHNSDFTGIILSIAETYFPGLIAQCYQSYGPRGYVKVHQFFRDNVLELFSQKPQALVIGCGGAGKAAAVAAAEMGFATVLMNRTHSKAQAIASELPEYGFLADPISDFRAAFKECDLVIYTLPMALDEIKILSESDFRGEGAVRPKVVLEANYKTPSFIRGSIDLMEKSGCKYISGRQWLLYQALTGYGLMTGEEPSLAAMEKALVL